MSCCSVIVTPRFIRRHNLRCFARILEECRAVISTKPEVADRLEELRQHLAARDAWVPVKDFKSH